MPDARGKAKLIYAASPPALSSFLSSFRLFALAARAHPIQSAAGKKERKTEGRRETKTAQEKTGKRCAEQRSLQAAGPAGISQKREAHEDMIPKE